MVGTVEFEDMRHAMFCVMYLIQYIHKNDEVFTSCCWLLMLLDWQEDGLHIWMMKQMIARYCKSLLESQVIGSWQSCSWKKKTVIIT